MRPAGELGEAAADGKVGTSMVICLVNSDENWLATQQV
jgi:hypothetical protein